MIVKCSNCGEMLADSEFEKHECNIPLKNHKHIDFVYFMDVSLKNKKLMSGMGTDGILYTFEVVPRKAIPITIPYPTKFHNKKDPTETSQNHLCSHLYTPLYIKVPGIGN